MHFLVEATVINRVPENEIVSDERSRPSHMQLSQVEKDLKDCKSR